MKEPIAKCIPEVLEIHNHKRVDPYFWLRDKSNPEVIEYLEAENSYTDSIMNEYKDLENKLYEEFVSRIPKVETSAPYKRGDYMYYSRYEEGLEYAFHCRKGLGAAAEEEILIDCNKEAEGKAYFSLDALAVSHNQSILAYCLDFSGDRIQEVHFRDLKTGKQLGSVLKNVVQICWANDNSSLFYSFFDDALRSHKIFRHTLGTKQSEDVLVYHEEDKEFDAYVSRTKSKDFILITSYSKTSNETYYLSANEPVSEPILFQKREDNLEYQADFHKGEWYILTNLEAQNFQLMRCSEGNTAKENWNKFIEHRKDVLLDEFELFENFLVLEERSNGLTHIRVKEKGTENDYYIPFTDPTYVAYVGANYDFDSQQLRYVYSSLTTPSTTFDFDMKSKEQTLIKQKEVLGGFTSENYVSERVFASAKDGIKVPVSLVYHKDTPIDGSAPLYVYSYGSYGYSTDPYFIQKWITLLDRGFVCAIAHIRGGQEMGRAWYEDGKFLKKKNTFTDFIACVEHLIENKYGNPEKVGVEGGSAGGLLMGAISNLSPKLFTAVLAAVPFVDVITTMLDETLPLTTGEYKEWGNPNDQEYYKYILSYSPYDNVAKQDYPAMLVTSGINDSQVHYWEPAKWVAKLRANRTNTNNLFLKINMDAGHQGASGRYKSYKELAFRYTFLLTELGVYS